MNIILRSDSDHGVSNDNLSGNTAQIDITPPPYQVSNEQLNCQKINILLRLAK